MATATANTTPPELLTEDQAAEILTVSPSTLQGWRYQGRYSLKFLKIGRNVRYRLKDLVEWQNRRVMSGK